MKDKAPYSLKKPSDEIVAIVITALRGVDRWRDVLQPALDEAIEKMKQDGHLSTSFSAAFDDLGRYCLSKGEEIRAERKRLGIGKPAKLPPAKY